MNVAAIREALKRSDIFVYFLSHHSVTSKFVGEEIRAALESRGKGLIKRVYVFALDDVSYKSLPEWLQEINVAKKIASPKLCARRIQASLLELAAEDDPGIGLYLGRDADQADLRKAIAVPPSKTPIFLHAVGHHGIGRRSFLTNSLKSLFPRLFNTFVEVTLGNYEGTEELYRQLFSLNHVCSIETMTKEFDSYSRLDVRAQAASISDILMEMSENGEFVIVVDEGGVYNDEGQFQPFLSSLLKQLLDRGRPSLGFVQTRMMPLRLKAENSRTYHRYLQPLSDEVVAEILSLTLKEFAIEYTEIQIGLVVGHIDGHPYNIQFALQYILNYGIDSIINDPTELIEWKNRRAADFLNKIQFNEMEVEIVALLSEYHFLDAETIIGIVVGSAEEITQSVRRLQDHCCIERRDRHFHIAAPIRDGVRRDGRFDRSGEWKQKVAIRICELVSEYENEDQVPMSIIGAATLASAKAKTPPAFLSHLILPSHLLRIAREHYDDGRRGQCMEFCQRAFAMKDRLPEDGQVEVLRLWGLSAIRSGDERVFSEAVEQLRRYRSRVAQRMVLFLEGFSLRRKGHLDLAEDKFLQAWRLAKSNQSLNRELASLYCKQRRYAEAEAHARAAYKDAPTNPFIIDIFAETLLGKESAGLSVNATELAEGMSKLSVYGDAPGSSFYLVRIAQGHLRRKDYPKALAAANRAIERTPSLLAPYFQRAEVYLASADPDRVDADLEKIGLLLTDAGGFSEGDETRLSELQVRLMIERRQFKMAKNKIDSDAFLSTNVKSRLLNQLARAVSFDPANADAELREWSKVKLIKK
ncbi:hypothetical protein NKH70_08320 [Mesorhizobium sp. M0991]|uniref:hypothetical protein n=1 Tax=Mesorhizobium sp. M0991 TaxID=2957043 RepID=UPI003335045F